jgi:hypothetical protein
MLLYNKWKTANSTNVHSYVFFLDSTKDATYQTIMIHNITETLYIYDRLQFHHISYITLFRV